MLRADKLDVDRASVLVIDLQEKLLPLILRREGILAAGGKLLAGARLFALPVLATEQYPKGLGSTDDSIRRHLAKVDAPVVEKPTISACDHPPVREALRTMDRPQVIVIGIEAHICVQQAVLDLRAMDYEVYVCADAVGSRAKLDFKQALHRMRQGGAFVTTVESVLFELAGRCDTPRFKEMIEIIKGSPPKDD